MEDCIGGDVEDEATNEGWCRCTSVELLSLTLNYGVKGLLLRWVEIKIQQVVWRLDELLLDAALELKGPLALIKDQSLCLNGVLDDTFVPCLSFRIIVLSVIGHQQAYLVDHLIDLISIFASCSIPTLCNFDLEGLTWAGRSNLSRYLKLVDIVDTKESSCFEEVFHVRLTLWKVVEFYSVFCRANVSLKFREYRPVNQVVSYRWDIDLKVVVVLRGKSFLRINFK